MPAMPDPESPRAWLAALEHSFGEKWAWVQRVAREAARLGMPAHVVGGAVRDAALGRLVHDVDLVIEAAELGAAAHVKVEGEWNDDLMTQIAAPAPIRAL